MIRFLTELLFMGLVVMAGAYFINGVHVDSYTTALLVAVLVALTNATIGLLLRILTFPINFLTLGLVSFLISVLMVMLVDYWLAGFRVDGFIPAAIFAIVIAIFKAIITSATAKEK